MALGIVSRSRNPRIFAKNLAAYPKALWLADCARDIGADHVHAHRASAASTLAMLAGEMTGIPWSFTAHRWDIFEDNLLGEKVRRARFARFIARSGVEEARRVAGRVLDEKAVVIHMGVPLPAAGGMAVRPSGTPVLLCPASLTSRKGHRYLLEAVALLVRNGVDVDLWLAGQGPERDALRARVVSLGIAGRVRFLGQMPQAQILDWYRTGQIFSVVLPSLHEGIPVSLMEAMSCGVPVISSRVGGTPELLEAGAGLLVPPADPAALADAITSLLEDARLWARTARIGRDRVEREFAIERVVSQLEERFAAPGSDPPEHQRRSPQEQRASAVAHELEDASRSAA
jgi:glycosyltransferase involved in cell wall biosynthesis